jgi:hypothetical protein
LWLDAVAALGIELLEVVPTIVWEEVGGQRQGGLDAVE